MASEVAGEPGLRLGPGDQLHGHAAARAAHAPDLVAGATGASRPRPGVATAALVGVVNGVNTFAAPPSRWARGVVGAASSTSPRAPGARPGCGSASTRVILASIRECAHGGRLPWWLGSSSTRASVRTFFTPGGPPHAHAPRRSGPRRALGPPSALSHRPAESPCPLGPGTLLRCWNAPNAPECAAHAPASQGPHPSLPLPPRSRRASGRISSADIAIEMRRRCARRWGRASVRD